MAGMRTFETFANNTEMKSKKDSGGKFKLRQMTLLSLFCFPSALDLTFGL